MDCSLPGSSIHRIFQARVLDWVATSFSRGSSRPRDQTWVSHTAGGHFTIWATWEAPDLTKDTSWESPSTWRLLSRWQNGRRVDHRKNARLKTCYIMLSHWGVPHTWPDVPWMYSTTLTHNKKVTCILYAIYYLIPSGLPLHRVPCCCCC